MACDIGLTQKGWFPSENEDFPWARRFARKGRGRESFTDSQVVVGLSFSTSNRKDPHTKTCELLFLEAESRAPNSLQPSLFLDKTSELQHWTSDLIFLTSSDGCGSKLKRRGYTGLGPCFYLPGFHVGTVFLSHTQILRRPPLRRFA